VLLLYRPLRHGIIDALQRKIDALCGRDDCEKQATHIETVNAPGNAAE
jgi:hypothetical protein